MSKVLVFVEVVEGSVKQGSLELLNWARTNGCPTTAVLLAADAPDSATSQCAAYGASKVITCTDAGLSNYNPQLFSLNLTKIIEGEAPKIVLASSSATARDLFPRVAAKLDAGVASDCTELSLEGGQLKVSRPMYAGKCMVDVEFAADATQIVLMRPNQLPVGEADSSASAETVTADFQSADLATQILEVVKGASEKLDLTEANIIVSGGRGLKDPENFKLLEELADVLGATVGASRAVVDAGWTPHSMQVGQTGKTVAPTLYFAIGISGAIQHLAGMSSSKVIVAVNQDAEAPIFQKATYGIVGDLFEVVPKMTEEFKKLLG